MLRRLLLHKYQSEKIEKVFDLLENGDKKVNPLYPGYEVYTSPFVIGDASIGFVYENLRKLSIEDALSALSLPLDKINKILNSDFDENPEQYLVNSFYTLKGMLFQSEIYSGCLVSWWD